MHAIVTQHITMIGKIYTSDFYNLMLIMVH